MYHILTVLQKLEKRKKTKLSEPIRSFINKYIALKQKYEPTGTSDMYGMLWNPWEQKWVWPSELKFCTNCCTVYTKQSKCECERHPSLFEGKEPCGT